MRTKDTAQAIFFLAGVECNGGNPWDIKVHDERFYARMLAQGALGFGESYMDGWWDCDQLDEFVRRLISSLSRQKAQVARTLILRGCFKLLVSEVPRELTARMRNRQTQERAHKVIDVHYERGNDLFTAMLGTSMAYSCGYWDKARTLDEAQEAKHDLICRKLGLERGMRVLDVGCGFGGFMAHAARTRGVECVGVTLSQNQIDLGKAKWPSLPIEFLLLDYRNMQGKFDRVVSIGMFEHVGQKNYRTFMEVAHRCLNDGGLFLLHTIGSKSPTYAGNAWTDKYIFPNGALPSQGLIDESARGLLGVEDWHEFGNYYDPTLMAWFRNFHANWDGIKANYEHQAGGRFYRMWKFYLLSCAGAFRAGNLQLWQTVFSKGQQRLCYTPVR